MCLNVYSGNENDEATNLNCCTFNKHFENKFDNLINDSNFKKNSFVTKRNY